MKALKAIIIVFVILIAVVTGFVLKTYWDAGEFKDISPHFEGDCTLVRGVSSSEDITVDPETGMAFISSDDRRALFRGGGGRRGDIYGYDLGSSDPVLTNLTADFEKEFHPHGIGLLQGESNKTSLFVVNHAGDRHFIEIFDYRNNRLIHRESIEDPMMTSPNDVLPVGERSFYVTNDHGSTSGIGRTLEEYLQLARSYVLYFDGNRFEKAAEDLAYANGINMNADGRTVYVAATLSWGVFVYNRDRKTGRLSLRNFIDTGTGVDNIEVDEKGELWIGAHPKILTFVKYSQDPDVRSPSQVIKLSGYGKGPYHAEEVYLNDGTPMSGSSVAAVFEGKLLMGSVFDPCFLICGGLK